MFWLLSMLFACNGAPTPGDWVEGDYQFTTLAVHDTCLDGALEALFMPDGPANEWDFEFPIFVPHPNNTPNSYNVDFREPFVGMPVTVEAGEAALEVRGGVMEAVLLNEAQYGDCVATMSVDADFVAVEAGLLAVEGRIAVSNLRGDEGRCPALDTDPCQVTLDVRAELLE